MYNTLQKISDIIIIFIPIMNIIFATFMIVYNKVNNKKIKNPSKILLYFILNILILICFLYIFSDNVKIF